MDTGTVTGNPVAIQNESGSDIESYAITAESLNFFVNEPDLVDFMFVHDEDSPADSSGSLTSSRLTGLNMGPDLEIGGKLQPGGITYGNIEVLEINLGSGNNDFTVFSTPTREDGFQTWTFLNTGDDIEWKGRQGDLVTVSLNAAEEIISGTVDSSAQATPTSFATLTDPGAFAGMDLRGQLLEVTNGTNNGVQTRRIHSNSASEIRVDREWETLPDGTFTYKLINQADGNIAVNTQGGDDEIDASTSTLGIVAFGGLGGDTITGGVGNDILFGDEGRVDYSNADGAIVTRLGTAPVPILGFVTAQVFAGDLTIEDGDAEFPVPDDNADGLGTDDVGLRGLYVDINNGKGFKQTPRLITDNTLTQLTISEDFDLARRCLAQMRMCMATWFPPRM